MIITHTLVHSAGNIRSTLYPILKDEFLLTNQHIGIIAAIPPIVQSIFSLPAGHMSDRYGAKKLIALSIGMGALGALIAGFTINPWMFIVATTLLTLNSTIYHPPAHSYSARLVENKDRAKAMGFLLAGGTFGVALGPLSITLLMGVLAFTWRQLYLFWVGPILSGFLFLYFAKIESSTKEHSSEIQRQTEETESFLSRSFLLYLSSRGIRMFAMSMAGTFLSVYLTEVKNWIVPEIGIQKPDVIRELQRVLGLAGRRICLGQPITGLVPDVGPPLVPFAEFALQQRDDLGGLAGLDVARGQPHPQVGSIGIPLT